jgi:hypothetical protein
VPEVQLQGSQVEEARDGYSVGSGLPRKDVKRIDVKRIDVKRIDVKRIEAANGWGTHIVSAVPRDPHPRESVENGTFQQR